MSQVGDPKEDQPPDAAPAKARPAKAHHVHHSLLAELFVTLVVLLGIIVVGRYGPLTDTGRAIVTVYLDGLKLGQLGKLHVEGVRGDIWSDVAVDRMTLSDTQGVWLEARQVELRWRPADLISRRFHAQAISAGDIAVLRRPILEPSPPRTSGQQPLSLVIDALRVRLDTAPSFSVREGQFLITANLDVERRGGLAGAVRMESLLRPGDGFDSRFDVGLGKKLFVDAWAREGGGGAIAGTLGLAADQPFVFFIHALGTTAAGQFHLRALSGGEIPASADGSWDRTSGSAQGRVSLTASSLTDKLTRQFGPELRLSVKGRNVGRALYDIAFQASSDNAAFAASGLVDSERQAAPKGLRVSGSIRDLTHLVSTPAMGRGAFDGLWTGEMGAWRWSGNAGVDRLAFDGYALAHAGGPVTIIGVKDELRIQASGNGEGGAGGGLIAALAGAKPHAALEAIRLADGRILLRSLSADGMGLSLSATGERGLFGELNFKGQARLSNLAAAHPGAQGQIDAHWTASQPRGAKPWSFSLDAQGDKLATGYGELDRLLGAKPAFHAQADLDQGAIAVNDARLNGAGGVATAKGLVGKDGALKLALNWNAQGPFTAGPVEIAGKASGSGALTGTFAAPRADLLADVERIDLPSLPLRGAHVVLSFVGGAANLDGLLAVTAASDYGPAHAKAGFQFAAGGVDLKELDAAGGGLTAIGSLSLRKSSASTADLSLKIMPGAFITQGLANASVKITDAAGGPVGAVRLTADNVVLRDSAVAVRTAQLSANGPLSHLPYTVTADAVAAGTPMRFSGSGTAAQTAQGFAVNFAGGGRIRRADFTTLTPAQFNFAAAGSDARLSLSLGGGRSDIETHRAGETLTAKGTLSGVDLGALGEDLAGKIDADFNLNGRGQSLAGTLNAHLSGARSRDAASTLALDGTIRASLADQRLTIDASGGGSQSGGGRATVNVVLPAEATAAPFRIAVNQTRPIQGQFTADGELQPIWDLFFGGDRTLGGRLTAQGSLTGTLNDPRMIGHAALTGGKFEDAGTGLKLRNLAANIDLNDNVVSVQSVTGTDAKSGTLTGDGRLSLVKGGSSTLTLNAHGFQLLDNEQAKATATGSVVVTRGGDGHAAMSGELNIDRADISAQNRNPPGVIAMDVIEKNRPIGQEEDMVPATGRGPVVSLAIKLRAARGIYVKGLGLNAEMSLNADIAGTTAAPVLQGTAHMLRGDYDFAGQRFQFDDRSVVYLNTSADHIRLDLTATRDDPSLTAVIKIKGTAAKPEITLSSTPVLPNDEVLAQVLFGRSAAQLSGVEAAQLAAAVTTLATGGGFDVMGGLRSFARLDRIAIGTDALPGVTLPGTKQSIGATTVSGGKYVSEHVYLELTGGGRNGPSAQVEVRTNRALSFISQIGGQMGASLAVRWRHDYGKGK